MVETIRLCDLAKHIDGPLDVLICSASFEERCKSIPASIKPQVVKSALVCENEELSDYVGENAKSLHEHFAGRSIRVPLSLSNPIKVADSMSACLQRVISPEPQNYFIDITTFTREALLILLSLLRQRLKPSDTVRFGYTGAKEYSLENKGQDKWLSKGIRQIRSVLGYAGAQLPTRKFHLIVLAGFEHERAAKLIDTYESAIISVGFGNEEQSITHEHYEINYAFHEKLCAVHSNLQTFSFSLTDPVQTKKDLERQISLTSGYNIVVAPLNNKISTVGAALAAFDDADIQLCYAQANFYNFESYSSPGDECYVFELPAFPPPAAV